MTFGNIREQLCEHGRQHTGKEIDDASFSPTFIIPSHKDKTPVSPSEISKAVFELSKVEFIMAGNTSTSPKKISFTKAITNAMMKNAIQM